MPHHINTDQIMEDAFVLMNLAYGAVQFAQNMDEDDEIMGQEYYYGMLFPLASRIIIGLAVNTRIMLDIADSHKDNGYYLLKDVDLIYEQKRIQETYSIGSFVKPKMRHVSLREALNKIIHANDVNYTLSEGQEEHNFDEESEEKRAWTYWGGVIEMKGRKEKGEWMVEIYVSEFCSAIIEMINTLENSVDWRRVYKYSPLYNW